MIYLTKEDWTNLILSKISDDESFNQDFLELNKIYNMINFFSRKLYEKQTSQFMIFIAAYNLFHKYRLCSNFSFKKYSSEELYILIGALIVISQKSVNMLYKRVDDISTFIKQIINIKNPNLEVDIDTLNKKIIQKEDDILSFIGFNAEIDSPYFFLNKLKTYLSKFKVNSDNFITLLIYILKDSFILPLCLYYTPNVLTISCVQLLIERHKLNFINIDELKPLSDYPIYNEEVQQCTLLIKKIEATLDKIKNQNKNVVKNETEKDKNREKANENNASITKVIPSIQMNIE